MLGSVGCLQEISEPYHRGAEFQAGEVALGRLIEACGDATPVLQPVDQSLDGVAITVETQGAVEK
jgi:hypothetical protein